MSVAPTSLLTTRSHMAAITGSPLGDIGIAADESHLTSGGYHCGALDLHSINAVGSDDYSIRQSRDRAQYNRDLSAGLNLASAMDYPDDWPNGGRAAWIRWNNLVRAALGARDPALRALRGMNFTPDGTMKRRFDVLTMKETASADTVAWHTHIEWWRDTINDVDARDDATTRLCALATQAITGQLPISPTGVTTVTYYRAPNGGIVLADNGVCVPVVSTAELNGISPAPSFVNLPQALFDRFVAAHDESNVNLNLSAEQLEQVKTSAHDGAAGAIDGATIQAGA